MRCSPGNFDTPTTDVHQRNRHFPRASRRTLIRIRSIARPESICQTNENCPGVGPAFYRESASLTVPLSLSVCGSSFSRRRHRLFCVVAILLHPTCRRPLVGMPRPHLDTAESEAECALSVGVFEMGAGHQCNE